MVHRCSLRVLIVLAILIGVMPAIGTQRAIAAGTADLAVTMDSGLKVARYGKNLTFTTSVTNLGPDAATGVVLGIGMSDSLADFGGTCPDGTVSNICEIGILSPGQTVTVVFRGMAANTCCPEDIGVAVASVSHDSETFDPNPDNDSVRVEIRLVGRVR